MPVPTRSAVASAPHNNVNRNVPSSQPEGGTPLFDVVVIGGGASGLAAAISAARTGARACIIERDVEAGLSILATGNGRCNLSNTRLDPQRYRHTDIARAVMGTEPEQAVVAFFDSLGLLMAEEGDGRLYPITRRAETVRDVLLDGCEREGVAMRCGCELQATRFDTRSSMWILSISEPAAPLRPKAGHDAKAALRNARKALASAPRVERTVCAHRVIIACGGHSKDAASIFGIAHVAEEPMLCPIACTPEELGQGALNALDGLRVEASCTLLRDGTPIAQESGEILFRTYGISGIAAFNLSRRAHPGDTLALDLFPELEDTEFKELLAHRERILGTFAQASPAWLNGMLAPALGALLHRATRGQLETLSHLCKRLTFRVSGTAEPQQAQVRRGGIPFSTVNTSTLSVQTNLAPNEPPALFACGEALDMDADCGGFNLAWAWLSGMRAGSSSVASLNSASADSNRQTNPVSKKADHHA